MLSKKLHCTRRELTERLIIQEPQKPKTLIELLDECKSARELEIEQQQKMDALIVKSMKQECFSKATRVNDQSGKEMILEEDVNDCYPSGLVLTSNHGYGAFQ